MVLMAIVLAAIPLVAIIVIVVAMVIAIGFLAPSILPLRLSVGNVFVERELTHWQSLFLIRFGILFIDAEITVACGAGVFILVVHDLAVHLHHDASFVVNVAVFVAAKLAVDFMYSKFLIG